MMVVDVGEGEGRRGATDKGTNRTHLSMAPDSGGEWKQQHCRKTGGAIDQQHSESHKRKTRNKSEDGWTERKKETNR